MARTKKQAEDANLERETAGTAEDVERETAEDLEPETGEGAEEKAEDTPKEADDGLHFPDPCVYCGPSIRHVARQYTTFMGGITNELREFVKEHPEAARLIVAPGKFAATRKKLETPGTAEALLYRKIKNEI